MRVERENNGREGLQEATKRARDVLLIARPVLVKPGFVVVLRKFLKKGECVRCKSRKRVGHRRLPGLRLELGLASLLMGNREKRRVRHVSNSSMELAGCSTFQDRIIRSMKG